MNEIWQKHQRETQKNPLESEQLNSLFGFCFITKDHGQIAGNGKTQGISLLLRLFAFKIVCFKKTDVVYNKRQRIQCKHQYITLFINLDY
jgi:hypothetical protein